MKLSTGAVLVVVPVVAYAAVGDTDGFSAWMLLPITLGLIAVLWKINSTVIKDIQDEQKIVRAKMQEIEIQVKLLVSNGNSERETRAQTNAALFRDLADIKRALPR